MKKRFVYDRIDTELGSQKTLVPGGESQWIICRNDPINFYDPDGRKTWPYTWKGWAGGGLMFMGGVMIFTPAAGPGTFLLICGAGFSIWDFVGGFVGDDGAFAFGKEIGTYDYLLKQIEMAKNAGYTVAEAQERGMLTPVDQLLAAGFSVQELRALGFVVEDETDTDDDKEVIVGEDIVVQKDEPTEGS